MRKIIFLVLVILLIGCSSKVEEVQEQDDYSGIKVSKPIISENNEKVHDIYNFDNDTKIVNVTTVCLDVNEKIIDMSDSYIMELPPESVSGWKPSCPSDTSDYRIDIVEIGGG